MRRILFGGLAAAAALAAVLLVAMRFWSARTVALDVEFKLTDQNYQPLPGLNRVGQDCTPRQRYCLLSGTRWFWFKRIIAGLDPAIHAALRLHGCADQARA